MSKVKNEETTKHEGNDVQTETPATSGYLTGNADFTVPNEYALYTSLPPSGDGGDQTTQPAVVLSGGLTLEDLRAAMQHFTHERDWDKFHTPRNLLCALVPCQSWLIGNGTFDRWGKLENWPKFFSGEEKSKEDCQVTINVGSVGEYVFVDFSDDEKNHVAEELADVLLYLVRLSDVCGFDLGQAAINKLQINTQKYPPEAVRGSPAKYTAYESGGRSRRLKYDIPTGRKEDEDTGRKRARERFTEDQVAAMTELAEKAEWSITALSWEERIKFCQQYNITKERLCNFFNNRKPKEMKRGRSAMVRRQSIPVYEGQFEAMQYSSGNGQHEGTYLKHMSQ